MYTIIGGDGREYGPVSVEQVRAWIATGRANQDTRAKREGTTEWRRIGDIPDFQDGTAEVPPPAGAAPLSGGAEAIAHAFIARSAPLDIGLCYERSWALLRANFWPLVGVTALVGLVQFGIWAAPIVKFALLFLGGVFKGGLYNFFLRKIRGQPASVADAFAGFTLAFAPLVAAGLLVGILSTVGLFLLIIPGIYLAVGYMFTYLLIVDRKLDVWTAMEVSRRVVTAQWWRLFGLALVAIVFGILGIAVLVVGILIALPLIEGAIVYAYEDLFSSPGASAGP